MNANNIARMSLDTIRQTMREDAYETATRAQAASVREAAKSGSLLWTKARITTTDNSRLDIRPDV